VTPGACQTAGSGDTACSVPWTDDARADAKTRLLEFVAGTPDGANLPHIVRTVFEWDTDMAGSDAQLARRFFESHPELFKTTQLDGYTWVYPRRAAFHLNRRKHRAKTTDGDGTAGNAAETGPDFAKDRARANLNQWSTIQSDSTRADMLGELATELGSIEDVWNVFERVRGQESEYLCLPYWTRFNSEQRASDLQASYNRAWDRAERQYDNAVVVTYTTDPKRHDSIADARDTLMENKNRISQWLKTDPKSSDKASRPGYCPTNLSVLEFTDSGIPHLHVVYFGVRWLTTQAALSNYWDRHGQGEVVDVRQLSKRGGEFVMPTDGLPDDPDAGGKRSARLYLGKSLRALSTVASMDPDEVADAVSARRSGNPRDTDDALWKVALYWALECRFFSGSPELTHDDPDGDNTGDGDDLPHVTVWRYVGTARYDEIPGYIQDKGQFLSSMIDRPPPPRKQSK
jgi:hypothetical protein